MQFSSFYNDLRKYGLISYIKSQFLLEAVKNANKSNGIFHNNTFWHNIALKLATNENIPTEYIPVKYIIISLENGYLELASKLYGRLGSNKEMQLRTENLLNDVLYASVGHPIKLAQVEEAGHLLKIVIMMSHIKLLLSTQVCEEESFNLLFEQIKHNLALSKLSQEDQMDIIDSFFNSGIRSKNEVKNALVYLKKIIPIYHQGAHFQEFKSTLIDPKKLKEKYPVDIILDKQGEINVWRTLGLTQNSYKSFIKINSHYDKVESIAKLMNIPVDSVSYGPAYRRILKCKIEGASLAKTLKEIQSKNLNIPEDIAIKVYYEELLDDSIYPLSNNSFDDSLSMSHVKIFEYATIIGENNA